MTELYSLHKDKIRVLLLEGVNDSAVDLIRSAGYTNLTQLRTALDEAALTEAVQGVRGSAPGRSSHGTSSQPQTG